MSDYLIDHALKNVWCTPDQDNQVIIKPARISPYAGVFGSWKVLWTSMRLPVAGARFHLFQIGQVHPHVLNLFPSLEQWTTLADSSMRNKTICDLYTVDGLQLPRTETWYRVTEERNVIVAIKENKKIPIHFNEDPLYIRVYNNQYFNSQRAHVDQETIYIAGGTLTSTEQLLALQSDFEAHKQLAGGVYCFRNGYKIKEISLLTCQVGDVVEFVHDTSIEKVIDFKLSGLSTFDSVLDTKGKYLLHYAGGLGETIDFYDDLDVFLINGTTQTGIYYHKNSKDAVRMLTHRDYSVPVSYVATYLQKHATALDFNNAYLRFHIRKSGYHRPLVNEHHRIKELYKLSDTQIKAALVGMEATAEVWRASELEQSAYLRLMEARARDITREQVVDAYGYNAVVKLLAEPILATEVFNSQLVAPVPYRYQANATAFEYDADGLLVHWANHSNGTLYNCTRPETALVEFVAGLSGPAIDDTYDQSTQTLNPAYDYRYYIALKGTDIREAVWTDVTGDTSKYVLTGNLLSWAVSATHHTLVRSNQRNLVREYSLTMPDGLLRFNLVQETSVDGQLQDRVLLVPMGELDIVLNGRSLIPNLDYFIDFPTVTICNKAYLAAEGNQSVLVRYKGLCQADFTHQDANEFGFIQNGRLSVDQQYDLRDDKILRIQVDGRLKLRSSLVFNEDTASFELTHALNGKPYLIKDGIVPLKALTDQDTYAYRARSQAVDQAISNYLTLHLGTANPESLNPISERYTLFSPFLSKLIMDLKDGTLSDPLLKQQYNDSQLRTLIDSYLPLLAVDPIHVDNRPPADFVQIHPHQYSTVVDLDIYQYTLMNRVIRLYAKDLVTLSNHAQIV